MFKERFVTKIFHKKTKKKSTKKSPSAPSRKTISFQLKLYSQRMEKESGQAAESGASPREEEVTGKNEEPRNGIEGDERLQFIEKKIKELK